MQTMTLINSSVKKGQSRVSKTRRTFRSINILPSILTQHLGEMDCIKRMLFILILTNWSCCTLVSNDYYQNELSNFGTASAGADSIPWQGNPSGAFYLASNISFVNPQVFVHR